MAKRGWYLLAYDIACPRRLQKVQRLLKGEGLAAQLSVFFVFGSQAEVSGLLDRVAELIHVREDDVRCWPVDHPGAVWFHGEPPVKGPLAPPGRKPPPGRVESKKRRGSAVFPILGRWRA
jgi:CRISPR-associated protein Cas2